MQALLKFMWTNREKLLEQMLEHVGLTFLSLFLALLLALPLGILITRREQLAAGVLGVTGILQTIPSIALLGFMLPLLGIGLKPAVFALFLYALLPIVRNTYTGIQEVDQAVVDAARGIGLTSRQRLLQVELPLALPVIFAGIRTATVINVGVATLAAYIGAGGLGEFIFGGIALNNSLMILAGAIPAALLAIFFDQLLALAQRNSRRMRSGKSLLLLLLLPLLSSFYLAPNLFTSGIRAGFPPEFLGRADGYPKLQKVYGLEFNTVALNNALMYKALREGEVDVISGYSTDGRIKAFNLQLLEDNRHAFPPYYCSPVINQQTARRHPELVEVVNLLAGRINDSLMTELNYRVDYLKQPHEEVALDFLKEIGLWKPDRRDGGETVVLGSKIFTEQYLLLEMFALLINGYTDLDVDQRPGLGGTKICFEALKQEEIDLYPEYTGTGLQALLQIPDSLVKELITDPEAVYHYVKKAFAEQHGIRWLEPLGFNNTYALMVRETQARKEGWEKISDLKATIDKKKVRE